MRQTSLLLLPLIPESPLFGIEALSAVATGTPILVSSNSGMASLLQELDEVKSIIHNKGIPNADAQLWNVRITEKLTKPDDAQKEAENIRAMLIQDTSIASSHLEFIRIVTGLVLLSLMCAKLEITANRFVAIQCSHSTSAWVVAAMRDHVSFPSRCRKFNSKAINRLRTESSYFEEGH